MRRRKRGTGCYDSFDCAAKCQWPNGNWNSHRMNLYNFIICGILEGFSNSLFQSSMWRPLLEGGNLIFVLSCSKCITGGLYEL